MKTCMICQSAKKDLTKHLRMKHSLTREEAYELMVQVYPDAFVNCTECGIKLHKTIGAGGRRSCSLECESLARKKVNTGRKQELSSIEKRIANTDQTQKQETRKNTMLLRYGSLYAPKDPEARRQKLLGRKCPRTPEHQQRIIDSKRRNGTLSHSEQTKAIIRHSVNALYQGENPPCTVSSGSPKGYATGTIDGIHYRSSYELTFLEYCFSNNVQVSSAATISFRVRYITEDGKQHFYYPDFYLPDYNCVIEIKPASMVNVGNNQLKINAGKAHHDLAVVTEAELCQLDLFFAELERKKNK